MRTSVQVATQGLLVCHRDIGKREDPGDEVWPLPRKKRSYPLSQSTFRISLSTTRSSISKRTIKAKHTHTRTHTHTHTHTHPQKKKQHGVRISKCTKGKKEEENCMVTFTALFNSTLTFRNLVLGLSVIQFTYHEKGIDNNTSRLVSRTKIKYQDIWCHRSLTNAKYSVM